MGREFIPLFEDWAATYDQTASGFDIEYKEAFRGYEQILNGIVTRSGSHVLEFGPGTGNLTAKLLEAGKTVFGVEPSPAMRKLAADKLSGQSLIVDGDFLDFPEPPFAVNTIVSSYAFHHLTDEEKRTAVKLYGKYLKRHDKIVFADTVFEHTDAYKQAIQNARHQGYHHLAQDLETEYYPTLDTLKEIFSAEGFAVQFIQQNDFVWILEAIKR
ncbi:class I SAM-dependent methyltransferase [Bacillus atrophaeus]|uniref:class I SAM-dependent DNA methyltransferase n=1 Tax=Bacillus atrophaeus TaxID=1452 RepID=UPI00032DDBA9|nr:class I SAM-dependent methyltransferase [Bacillus atrophaeus]AKL86016.1 YrrT [Bacillus atrophaeus UCMB-5137]ARW07651.1 putative methyltransferase [Bacillus atrophaeus]ASS72018.1 SAM-dependent methyltransferase [Bacillus atrophaeus]ATO28170.1 class I SAM-dependent methyltransferase [Bacillus atrophaeus]MBU5262871.1 class I SAM-dependent methyltransferase [Bacillus atrophaeus]